MIVRFLPWYYLLTPLFVLCDVLLGTNFRIPFLDGLPWAKYTYYATAFAFGLVMYKRPSLAGPLGALESLTNIVLLVVGFMSAIMGFAYSPWEHAVNPVPPRAVVSFALSAAVLYGSYLRWTLRQTRPPDLKELERRVRRNLES